MRMDCSAGTMQTGNRRPFVRSQIRYRLWWGEKKMYGKVTEGTLRTTYVIDEQGIIVDAIGKVNTKAHTEQILK